jgi:cytochrome o ubiquinol oxidase operon protein cyoD
VDGRAYVLYLRARAHSRQCAQTKDARALLALSRPDLDIHLFDRISFVCKPMTNKRYLTGFIACILLTAASFALVEVHVSSHHQFPTHTELAAGILVLAIMQLLVQLVFFLHIGRESKRRDIAALAFALTLIGIVVGGSLWIMANLTHTEAVPFYDSAITPQASTD